MSNYNETVVEIILGELTQVFDSGAEAVPLWRPHPKGDDEVMTCYCLASRQGGGGEKFLLEARDETPIVMGDLSMGEAAVEVAKRFW